MNQNGRWTIVQSNDPLVKGMPQPRIVDISPGKFSIAAKTKIFGGFRFEPGRKDGIYVSMTPFNIPLLKQVYHLVPLDPDRIALFGTGARATRYYLLERVNGGLAR